MQMEAAVLRAVMWHTDYSGERRQSVRVHMLWTCVFVSAREAVLYTDTAIKASFSLCHSQALIKH